ncbi:hypothetical protein D6C97_10025 [Aureobasidium pullulans]|nr:hypothetical protein D6C97_10025 [Aureobasidium pullulans]
MSDNKTTKESSRIETNRTVEHAEWDVRNFGDQYGGLELLALARRILEDLLESEPICHTGQGTTGHEER